MLIAKLLYAAIFCVWAVRGTNTLTDPVYWDLEDYNSWNLPFAKTVQIEGIKNLYNVSDTNTTDDSRMHYLTADSYKLEVDTSALFSVLFVSSQTFNDYNATTDLRTLNYTFLGDEEMLSYEGVWTDVRMTIPKLTGDTDDSNLHKFNMTIFVALGDAPDAGLDGTLALSMLPNMTSSNSTSAQSWRDVSIFRNAVDLPMVYISY